MKIISVHCRQGAIESSDAQLTAAMTDTGIAIHMLSFLRVGTMLVRFEGASLTMADVGRNVGTAALGAVAGGVLLGPLGMLAGGALGGRKSHTLVLNSPDARVVLEASTAEYQRFLGLGLPMNTPVEIQNERLPPMPLRWWVKPGAVLACLFTLLILFNRRGDAPTASAAPSTLPASAAITTKPSDAVPAAAKAAPKTSTKAATATQGGKPKAAATKPKAKAAPAPTIQDKQARQ